MPGIGLRHDVVLGNGRRVAVVTERSGQRTLALFSAEDADAATDSVGLSEDEATALANVLGASVMLGELVGLPEQASGLYTEQISVPVDSGYAGRPLGDTRARTRTGVSIVAILRGGQVIASPTPADRIDADDKLVAVGTRQGLDSLTRLIATGTA